MVLHQPLRLHPLRPSARQGLAKTPRLRLTAVCGLASGWATYAFLPQQSFSPDPTMHDCVDTGREHGTSLMKPDAAM